MKSAFNENMDNVDAIFRLWYEKGFLNEKSSVMFFLTYLMEIRDLPMDQIKKKLEESNIDGGDLMASIAQQLREEGKIEGKIEGKREGQLEGRRLEKLATAKKMIKRGADIDYIAEITGLPKEEIEKYIPKSH